MNPTRSPASRTCCKASTPPRKATLIHGPRGPAANIGPESRFPLLSRALLPAKALSAWRASAGEPPPGLRHLSRLTTADQQEEAEAIALILRGALETPGARAALVTPDRSLANRVTDALARYGVVADDSAGEALMDTPPAVFLRLLIRAVTDNLAPVSLLALLKHPLAGAGLSEAACRHGARALEMICLRGPRPIGGIAGIRMALDKRNAGPDLKAYWARVESCLEPVFRIQASVESAPVEALTAVIAGAERLAATDDESGPSRLWSGEEGDALAIRLTEVLEAIPDLPDQRRAVLAGLLDAVLRGVAVRERRAVRGRGGALHPRIFVWGLLEARLQSVDLLVLGGLAETIWPPATDPGPWLSRPMRAQVGLPTPEEVIGQAAHDFTSIACSAREVVLSCPTRRDGAPAVPARWLTRLEMYLAGRDCRLPAHPAAAWARDLDLPAGGPRAARQPAPRPPVAIRPRRLSVTEIETWLRDPYSIYARHILNLKSLKPLDEPTDAADYGSLVHAGMNHFLRTFGETWPDDAYDQMLAAMNRALREAELRPALRAWWKPRLERIAGWLLEADAAHRAAAPLVAIHSEALGRLVLRGPAGDFRLTGKADRIDLRADGTLAILDYKTGTIPGPKAVDAGLAPQLPLEAAMAAAGAFGPDAAGPVTALIYWHLTGGGASPGEERALFKKDPAATLAASAKALDGLRSLIATFDSEEQPYVSQPNAALAPRFSDYAQLARVVEWSAAGATRITTRGTNKPMASETLLEMPRESPRDRANRTQRDASDPGVSAFVAASAGSGKTKLLTDRLLRLMLTDGVRPERILCLTFTRAAAAEMSLRLQRLLGRWVTMDDAALNEQLASLALTPSAILRERARALFALVLDLPGGMRISTIHAFCQSLLRRFPLEAALSPHFRLVDDRDAEDTLSEARESMLARAEQDMLEDALRSVAGQTNAEQFGKHVKALLSDRVRLAAALTHPDLAAAQRRVLGVTAADSGDIIAAAVNWQAERELREAAGICAALGSPGVKTCANAMLGWLGLSVEDRVSSWATWRGHFLTGKDEPRAASRFVSKAVTDRHPDLAEVFIAEAARILEVSDSIRAVKVAELSAALIALAWPVLRAYTEHKDRSGLLDYADLIVRTSQLLVDPGAAWVLYKLDGGIDHLLLDEVQDIAPQQWDIAHALTSEFFSGMGARDVRRTVFAVGDRKQSIYEFQGANISTFEDSRSRLAGRVDSAGETWRDLTLDVSFRSTRPVLSLVDAVFADPSAAAGVVSPVGSLAHFADRAGQGGTVELWPLAPVPDSPEHEPWTVPERSQAHTTSLRLLADRLADWIKDQTNGSVTLESQGRPLRPGDVMVLVRRRQAFGEIQPPGPRFFFKEPQRAGGGSRSHDVD